jgi:putative ABC transport system ATP-binding protein
MLRFKREKQRRMLLLSYRVSSQEIELSSLLKLEHITKVYHLGGHDIHALAGINLDIKRDDMLAIMGASGSGKSTLMNIIGFLDRATSGRYFFDNKYVSSLNEEQTALIRNQKIGFVFQSFFLLPRLSALQNVILPLFYRGIDRADSKKLAMAMLHKVGVAHLAEHKPQQLSGGQQQRVAIARALVTNPDLILADEPTGALDSKTGGEVMDLFINLNRQEGRTIVIITHDKEVSERCKRVVTIKDGKMVDNIDATLERA